MSAHYNLRRLLEDAPKEHQGRPLLCIPSEPDPRDYKYSLICGVATGEPQEIDYRPNLPPVFDQLQRGSCVACAATYTVKAWQEINQGDYPAGGLSVAYLYTMCKKLDQIPNEEGTYPRTAMKVLKDYGICREDTLPYSSLSGLASPKVPSIYASMTNEAAGYKIVSYAQIASLTDADRGMTLAAMRQALKSGPTLGALLVCANFAPDANNVLPLPSGQILGGHAIGIVGDQPSANRLILRNSWGSDWGENGYAYLPYEWLTSRYDGGWYFFESWSAIDQVIPKAAKEIKITNGSDIMLVDGVEVYMDKPAEVEDNRLMVPLRAIGSNQGYLVNYVDGVATLIKAG